MIFTTDPYVFFGGIVGMEPEEFKEHVHTPPEVHAARRQAEFEAELAALGGGPAAEDRSGLVLVALAAAVVIGVVVYATQRR